MDKREISQIYKSASLFSLSRFHNIYDIEAKTLNFKMTHTQFYATKQGILNFLSL